jgi:D-glycero-alpha-D-manno-heptose 1-phosphate guanylyltransferase
MVGINGDPFLTYLLEFLSYQGIGEIVLSVGYKAEAIREHFRNEYRNILIKYAHEDRPLGTGGAIKNALQMASGQDVFVLNGDTLFPIDMKRLFDYHRSKSSSATLALKAMTHIDRYGTVSISDEGRVVGFHEKCSMKSGLINGGTYVIRCDVFDGVNLPDNFSFEVDFLQEQYEQKEMYGLAFNDYFIDIGVPDDYERAKREFKRLRH